MELIPVLDVRRGRAVRAGGGDRARYPPLASVLAPGSDPRELARACRERLGTGLLYVADLDAIESAGAELVETAALVRRLAGDGARVWIDAGTSDDAGCTTLLGAGAGRVVVGLETLREPAAVAFLPRRFGAERLAFSLDLRGGRPLAPALRPAALEAGDVVRTTLAAGFSTLIVLDLDRVGSRCGPGLDLLALERREAPESRWVAGGGVRDGGDLRALAQAGWDACLVGTAIHEGRVGLEDLSALAALSARHGGGDGSKHPVSSRPATPDRPPIGRSTPPPRSRWR